MPSARYDFIIVGGGSAGSALANRLSADPARQVLVLEAGRPDYLWDVFIHMPAALTFPIGSRFYDWKYESEPEPYMNGRRIYHARGKVLGGSSSINGMIFQRGNPLDYERWAADPGMETWDYAHCLPYFKRMENCLAGRATSTAATTGRWCWSAARPPTRCSARSSRPCSRPATRSPTTSTATGRRASRRSTATSTAAGGCRRRAGLPAPGHGPAEPDRAAPAPSSPGSLFEGTRAVGVEYRRGGARRSRPAPARSSCAAARSTPRSCSSCPGVGNAARAGRAGVERRARPAGRRREPAGSPGGLRPVRLQAAGVGGAGAEAAQPADGRAPSGCSCAAGPGATNHFEGGGFARSNEDVAYPNLMFHFLPIAIRYDGSAPAGGHGYQVHIGPMYSDARGSVRITSTDPAVHPALRFNYLSTEQDRREWVEAIRVARTS